MTKFELAIHAGAVAFLVYLFGWQNTYFLFAIMAAVIGPLGLITWFDNRPRPVPVRERQIITVRWVKL